MAFILVMKLAATRCHFRKYEYKCTFLERSLSNNSELFRFLRNAAEEEVETFIECAS